jgi:hypothetical protein
MTPRAAAWILIGLFAVAVAAGVYRIPIQVSDNLEILEQVDALPSVRDAFVVGLHSSTTMLRPTRQLQTKLLLNLAHAAGDRYNAVFRGYHALGAVALILLFGALARPHTWLEVAALAFALTVLTGLHTFAGMVREAYPVNHFLLVALACLVTLALSRSRGGALADALAMACLAFAILTLESGLLVAVIAVTGYIAGRRGISKGALIVMGVIVAGYLVLRVGVLDMHGYDLGERQTGFGTRMLSAAQQKEEFGDNPLPLYAYTIAGSVLTVPFSQPVVGQWTVVRAWQDGQLVRSYAIEIVTSLAATALIAWFLLGRSRPDGLPPAESRSPRRFREPLPLAMLAVLVVSAGLSYSYAKSEIMSAAGVLYALVAYAAAAEALRVVSRKPLRLIAVPVLLFVVMITSGWAFRAVGLQYKLQRGAFTARNEWVLRMPPFTAAPAGATLLLAPRLREEALQRGRTSPFMDSRRAPVYWGED